MKTFEEWARGTACISLLLAGAAFGQNARIWEEKRVLKTYPYTHLNPVPNIGPVYPYYRLEGYTNQAILKAWKMVILENPYLTVSITPEILKAARDRCLCFSMSCSNPASSTSKSCSRVISMTISMGKP